MVVNRLKENAQNGAMASAFKQRYEVDMVISSNELKQKRMTFFREHRDHHTHLNLYR